MPTRWRLQVGLALAGCLLASSCGGTSGRSTAVASTSTSTTTTTTTRPPTTTSPPLSGSYLAKWSIGGMLLRLTMTGSKTVEGLAVYRFCSTTVPPTAKQPSPEPSARGSWFFASSRPTRVREGGISERYGVATWTLQQAASPSTCRAQRLESCLRSSSSQRPWVTTTGL